MIYKKSLNATRCTLHAILSNAIRYTLYAMFVLILGCAARSPLPEKPTGEFIWPPPPETPRIKWLTQWSNSQDFKKVNPLDVLIGEAFIDVLFRPNGVVADKSGNIYVADSQLRKIFVFDMQKFTLRFLGEGDLAVPIGLAIDNKRGIIYVSDSKLNKVFGLDKNTGRVVISLGITGEFNMPSGIVYDEDRDRLYVSDTKNHIVRVYDKDGKRLFTIGKQGRDDSEFHTPSYLALDRNGRLYVVDSFNFRVQIFDTDGKFVKKFGRLGNTSGSFSRPGGIGVDSEGHIYVVDTAFNNFQIFNDEGRLLLWIGKRGIGAGEFSFPAGMHIDSEDRIYVTDTFNRRVQVFQYLKEKK
ncbi:MAG: 6-bladed beta-propeller [Nitrospirae bacterium]|nr:6-bladed beta-propeller [Nitrospirota bacterium]